VQHLELLLHVAAAEVALVDELHSSPRQLGPLRGFGVRSTVPDKPSFMPKSESKFSRGLYELQVENLKLADKTA